MRKVSLILATISRREEVGRCLRSLAEQTDRNFEVLVIDQNSDDRLQPYVREATALGVDVKYFRMAVPSLSGARNLGIANASGDIVGLTDDDCWYEPSSVENIRQVFLKDSHLDGVVGNWVEQSQSRRNGVSTGLLSSNAWRNFRGGDASSISLFFKIEVLIRLDGFDERFGIGQWFGAGEETDFVLRALAGGARIIRCSNVKIHHHFESKNSIAVNVSGQNLRQRARGTGGIYAKHRLTTWTIIRGLFGPILQPLMKCNLKNTWLGFFVVFGRVEGYLHWKSKY